MEAPKVEKGDWIKIKSSESDSGIDGYVLDVFSAEELGVGYYQNNIKAIKENVVWSGSHWKFKYSGPSGSYLKGHEEAIVKHGPLR